MIRRPPGSTRTDTLFPYTTLFRSLGVLRIVDGVGAAIEAARLEPAVRGHVAHHVVAECLLQAHRRGDGRPVVLGAEGDGFIERAERCAPERAGAAVVLLLVAGDRKSTRLNSSH